MTLTIYPQNEAQRQAFIAMATAMSLDYDDDTEIRTRKRIRLAVAQTREIEDKLKKGDISGLSSLDDLLAECKEDSK